jgi:23S rRNA pseudouridine1911/1915/1917 synthase
MSSRSQSHRFVVDAECAGDRLDRFLANQLPELSRSRIQTLIEDGRVEIDGRACKASHHVASGETITVSIPAPAPAGVSAEAIPLHILYEDDDLVVLNKAAGIVVHPGAAAESGTLVSALLHRFGGIEGLSDVGGPLRPGIVHRLDKETSGALVIARTNEAHRALMEEFRSRKIEKQYVALLHGNLKGDSGRVEMPVARDLRRRSRMTARRSDGRPARTDWTVRLRLDRFTLIDADLHTGRTHQIRVHFSALGCPVVGDTLYGAPRQEKIGQTPMPPLGRNFLHAARIAFEHPRTGQRVDVRAPLPKELVAFLHALGAALGEKAARIDAALRDFL